MKTIKQQLAAELRKMKPKAPRDQVIIGQDSKTGEMIYSSSGETEADCKQELKRVQQHIRDKFEQARSSLIIHCSKTRQQAEAEAFKQAMFRIQSWNGNY